MRHGQFSVRLAMVPVFAATALLAAGCTQDKGADEGSNGTSGGDDTPAENTGEPGPGVSEDAVKVGYAYLDFDDLVEKGLSPNGWGDQERQMQAQLDALNEAGGVGGRQIEMVFSPYTPLGVEVAEAVCLELGDDEDVFAVLGGFNGPAEPANSCIVGQEETVLVGGVISEERLEEAKAPWFTGRPIRSRQANIMFNLLDEEGDLADAKVAVVSGPDAQDVRESVIEELDSFGVTPVSDLVSDGAIGDVPAEDNAWAAIAENIRTDGADTVLLVGNPSAGIRNIASQGLDVDTWVLDQEALTALGTAVNLEDARGVLSTAPMTGQEAWDDETSKECRDNFTEANPDVEVIEPDDLVEGDEDVARGVLTSCRYLDMFKAAVDNVDGELNNESFDVAAADLGDFELPGQPFNSWSADKHDANDAFRLVSFNPDTGQNGGFDDITDITDVTS